MGYNTTGQSHKNGNKGEKQVEGFFRLKKGRCFGLDEEYGEFIEIQQLTAVFFVVDNPFFITPTLWNMFHWT